MTEREIIFEILWEVYEKGAYANLALGKFLRQNDLSDVKRRFITEVVYGTVKVGDTLLWQISRYSNLPLPKMQKEAQVILRLSFYQLFYLDKIPARAICNEAVNLAKKYGNSGMARFINGILRSSARDKQKGSLDNLESKNELKRLSLFSYHPLWLVELFKEEFGLERTKKLCAFDNEEAPLCLRCNLLRTTRQAILDELAAEGVKCRESKLCPDVIICEKHHGIAKIAALREGRAAVQDEASCLVAHLLDPKPGQFIIDCCSAPGGKALHLATLMQNRGRVLANDIYAHKMALIEQNAQQLGVSIIETLQSDARTLGEEYYQMADGVLADVPCSGLGVLRRKADARWHKAPREIALLPQLQFEILQSAAAAVKKGGILVYSTCTILKRENETVVERFLAQDNSFKLVEQRLLLPDESNTDGFFMAKMVKR